jgi:diguanylate cyclase (GGDEF)-like protein
MRVLIAEANAFSRIVMRQAVEHLGHECLVAGDGLQAWELFVQSSPEVVISEWSLPGIDGSELCVRVREHAVEQYPYFIFLTALTELSRVVTAMAAGADDYLTKPPDRDQLEAKLIAAGRVIAQHRRLLAHQLAIEQLNRRLHEQARRDSLTGLANRLQLAEDLDALLGRVERYDHTYCLALCDIDRFKSYNDTYGRLAGDEVLRTIARTMQETCRAGDAAYRYGGEEFLVLLPEQTLNSASSAMNRLRKEVESLALAHTANEPMGLVTISVGVSVLGLRHGAGVDAALREAHSALYRAKEAGRNCVAVAGDTLP